VSNLRRFGFGDDDVAGGGSDKLISAIIPSGPEAVLASVRGHLAAGADHVLLRPLAGNGRFAAGDLDGLASVLKDLLSATPSTTCSGFPRFRATKQVRSPRCRR